MEEMSKYRIYEQDSHGVTKKTECTLIRGSWRQSIVIDNNYAVAVLVKCDWMLIHCDEFFNWDKAQQYYEDVKEIVDYVGIRGL